MRRARVPTRWLFTDERLGGPAPGDPLWAAIHRLPRGGGIVFRHYSLPADQRHALLQSVLALARRRGLLVLGAEIGGTPGGRHLPGHARNRHRPARWLLAAAAHDRRALLLAFRQGADLVFLSPVFPTRSHPGGRVLGPVRFGLAAAGATGPVIALGGMGPERLRRLKPLGASGFAGIDCWLA